MALTLIDLKELLAREDEVYLLELLNISSEEIVERFDDFIEDRFDQLILEYEEDDN